MKTITVQAEVSADQILRVEIPCDLRPGPVEVVLTIPKDEEQGDGAGGPIDWKALWGLGRDVWEGVDARAYLDELRADREYGQ